MVILIELGGKYFISGRWPVVCWGIIWIHMSNVWICVMSCVRLAGRPLSVRPAGRLSWQKLFSIFFICTCSAQLSMFHMKKRSRNTLIIIIIIIIIKNLNIGHYAQTFQPISFIPAVLFIRCWLLPFCTTFSDLDRGWGSLGQHKAKPVCFIFSHTVQLSEMFRGGDEAIYAEHLEATISEISVSREIIAGLLTASKNV